MSAEKRKHWRAQEQDLVARWNAAVARHQQVLAEIDTLGSGTASAALLLKVQNARAEVDTLRREVARLKVEFTSGKRY